MNTPMNYTEMYQRRLKLQSTKTRKNRNASYDKISTKRSLEKDDNDKNTQQTFKQKLKKIFDLYAQMGESVYTTKLKLKKFTKLCVDMNILDQSLPPSSLELLVVKVLTNKVSCINFDKFIELLNAIAKVKEPNDENYFKTFLNKYPIKLYERLFTDKIAFSSQGSFKNFNDNNEKITKSSLQGDSSCNNIKPYGKNKIISVSKVDDLSLSNDFEELLKIISVPMFELYKFYFPLEFAATVPEDYSIKQFIKFTTDFDLFPYLITKDELFQIFQEEIDNKVNQDFEEIISASIKDSVNNVFSFGKHLSFFKFLKGIFHIADIGLDKIPFEAFSDSNIKAKSINVAISGGRGSRYTTFEKICLVLERLELSEIFSTINLKPYCLTHIISPGFLGKIKKEIISREENLYENLGRNAKENRTICVEGGENKFLFFDYIMEKYSKELRFIFNLYSEESVSLKQSRFIKILLDSDLIKSKTNNCGITVTNADLLFISITNPLTSSQSLSSESTINFNSSSNPALLSAIPYKAKPRQMIFTFPLFLNSIELLSRKIYYNKQPRESIDMVCERMISKLCQGNINEDNLLDLIYKEKDTNEEFENVYTIFLQTIFPIFNIYIDLKNTVSLKSFYKFAYDFGLFPQSITKNKLLGLFKTTYNYGRDLKDIKEDVENVIGLTHQMFSDVLIQIAFEIPYGSEEPNDIEKVIFLADRLSQSEGMNKIILSLLSSTKLVYGKNFDMMALFKENYPNYFQDDKSFEDYQRNVEESRNEEILNEIS